MTEVKIKKLIFNNETEIELGSDDIVLIVGPNNAGKSQILKDIYKLLSSPDVPGVVVKSIEIEIKDKGRIENDLLDFSVKRDGNHYVGAGFDIYTPHLNQLEKNDQLHREIVKFLTSHLSTTDRLKLVDAQERIRPQQPRVHPIHYIDRERKLIDAIDKAFNDAFGLHLILNDYDGKYISFSVGKELVDVSQTNKPGGKQRIEITNEYIGRIVNSLPKLENQGDGMKSFVGILLNLFVEHYSIFFIDEPESFLHPPQAYIMGKQISGLSTGKQLLLATHSADLLKGLMDSAGDRLKILRVDRIEDENTISILNSGEIKKLWSDPLIRYSNILESLFYHTVVVCESNADCKFYRMIFETIQDKENRRKDVLFVEVGGKQRFNIVCSALTSLNINFRVIPDFDIFRQDGEAKKLYDSCGGDWDKECASDWKIVDESLPVGKNEQDKEQVRERINNILDNVRGNSLSDQDLKNLRGALKGHNKWDTPKEKGLAGIADEEAWQAAERLMSKFNQHNIFPVPSGEMESFVIDVNGHGKEWLENVLDEYKDLSDKTYDAAREYLKSLGIHAIR